jgi:hypothetical protein
MTSEIENQLPSITDFYINTSLYTFFKTKQTDKEEVFEILFNMDSLDCYCIDCNSHSVFKAEDNKPRKTAQLHGLHFPITDWREWQINLTKGYFICQKEYTCSRNPLHKLIFILQIQNGKLSKIGQSPALADIAEQEIKKYKKILGNTQYQEFSKAIGLYTHGIGVGSFVYLRRIIENFIIIPVYEKCKIKEDWNDDLYQKGRVKDKIEILKEFLPDFLVSNPNIYSIISKGIHDLSEDECKEFFPVLKTCIEFVLTDLETKRETEQKRAEMQNVLGQIASKIK